MKKTIGYIALISIFMFSLSSLAQEKTEKPDRIKILQITPSERVTRGTEVEFTFDLEYKLESAEEGSINIGFNTDNPNSYRTSESEIVKKGSGTVTIKVKTVVVDWGKRGRFTAFVNLSKHPHDLNWQPLDSHVREIPVEP